MSGWLAVFRREMRTYWVTPLAWALLTVFLVLQGISFFLVVRHLAGAPELSVDAGPVQAFFGQSIFLVVSLLLVCPALTMRLFAEERRSGTLEALLTAPVTPAGVVLGKYLGVLTTYCLLWAPTVLYVAILRHTGTIDWGVVAASYLGVLGIGAGYLAIGTLMSALTRSQLVAFMLTSGVVFGLFLIGIGEYVFEPGLFLDLSAHVSVFAQMDELSRGIVDSRRLVFDLTLVLLPLFVAVRVVDSWRWE
jgi:ABC-2 type transport system permease protein